MQTNKRLINIIGAIVEFANQADLDGKYKIASACDNTISRIAQIQNTQELPPQAWDYINKLYQQMLLMDQNFSSKIRTLEQQLQASNSGTNNQLNTMQEQNQPGVIPPGNRYTLPISGETTTVNIDGQDPDIVKLTV